MNLRVFNHQTRQFRLAMELYDAYRVDGDVRRFGELSEVEKRCWCACAAWVEARLKGRR